MAARKPKLDPDDLATQLLLTVRPPLKALKMAEEIGSGRGPQAQPFAMAAAIIRDKLHLEGKMKGYTR